MNTELITKTENFLKQKFDDDGRKDHGRNAAKIARPFLLELGNSTAIN
ncbi:MAG: hypothetical protein ILA11_05975 [Butyrivibrio sp.]|nr:hypothetical protein [Butyrivibrio sp.]